MSLKVYTTSVTASREIKSLQAEVTRVLESKCKEFENVDISQDNCLREEMRTKAGNPTAMPPQIFNGDMYCGEMTKRTDDSFQRSWMVPIRFQISRQEIEFC
ncbi:SH3 domain-binding glutamic acid-rich-like protein 3 isoform X1 [Ambystoma mexicanum]|uniref:SH3 domain-binding glutamic acid-rich-like protein 3 isoform X1 n=1 Tax=Ambystoma mexicanum TaxID=8296 RepID=UPI0037E94F83